MRELSSAATAFCKANRICAERFPGLLVACTVDLLAHPTVRDSLGKDALATAVFGALYHGRMRVLALHSAWAIELIRDSRDPPGFILAENFLLVALSVRRAFVVRTVISQDEVSAAWTPPMRQAPTVGLSVIGGSHLTAFR